MYLYMIFLFSGKNYGYILSLSVEDRGVTDRSTIGEGDTKWFHCKCFWLSTVWLDSAHTHTEGSPRLRKANIVHAGGGGGPALVH